MNDHPFIWLSATIGFVMVLIGWAGVAKGERERERKRRARAYD
jgi:hypothetical protein